MRWSKVRKLVHDSFADSVRGRVKVNVTNADPRGIPWRDGCNVGWIELDGELIARFDPHGGRRLTIRPRTHGPKLVLLGPELGQKVTPEMTTSYFMDLTEACWQYLHSSIKESLESPDPFVSSLAVLNVKVGRTRLLRAQTWDLHPLTRAVLEFRLQAERDPAVQPATLPRP